MNKELIELPEGWIWASIEELLRHNNSLTYGILKPGDYVANGVPMLRVMDIGDGKLKDTELFRVSQALDKEYQRTRLEVGDVVLAVMATIGRTMVVPESLKDANVNRALAVLKLSHLVSPEFICWSLRSPYFQRIFIENQLGTAQKRINLAELRKFNLALPPLNEQHRIVSKIEALKARSARVKESLSTIPALLDQFRQSVLAAAFRGDLTAEWRRQDNDKFLDYDFPPTWKKAKLSDVVEGLKQGWSPKCENLPSTSDDIWGVIKTTAVQSLYFVEGENKQLPLHLKPRPDLEIFEGDLLITRAGPRVRAGVTCLVSSVRPKLMLCDKVYRFRAKESCVLPIYLAYFLNSPLAISLINELKTGISDSGVNLTQEKFLALPLWFPPLEEQKEIVHQIKLLFKLADTIEQQYQQSFGAINQFDQSILSQAFRGELVPQDPNDEPASVLLERIRTQREKTLTPKTKRTKKTKPVSQPTQMELEL
jgi:type I restriction enzyme, S subunit